MGVHAAADAGGRVSPTATNISQILAGRLQELEERFREIATEKVAKRLALALTRLLKQVGKKTPEGIEISLSREELAQLTGTTLFTISRILSKWADQALSCRAARPSWFAIRNALNAWGAQTTDPDPHNQKPHPATWVRLFCVQVQIVVSRSSPTPPLLRTVILSEAQRSRRICAETSGLPSITSSEWREQRPSGR